jgi:hypothetical protein
MQIKAGEPLSPRLTWSLRQRIGPKPSGEAASGFLFQSALVQVTQALVQSLRPPDRAAKVINEPFALSYDPICTLQKRIF